MLFKKMLRTIKNYRAQFISMIIMIAIGIGVFAGFNMEWKSLDKNTRNFFEETNFADYRIYNTRGFTTEDLEKVLNIDGVKDATRYLSVNAQVKDTKKIIALTVCENFNISSFKLMGDGLEYDKDNDSGIWLSEQYANKNDIKIGDTLDLTYQSFTISCNVVGLIKASEYLICVPDESQLMPDYHNYGYGYISPAMLKKVLGMELYTQINIKSDLTKKELSGKVDSALDKATIILSKDETIAYSMSQGEVQEGKTMGSILPVMFLAIAILTMVTTMHRLAVNEKTQIGILKALGFKDKKIIWHYTSFSFFIGIIGTVIGIGLGYLIAYYIMNPNGAMGTYIDMPDWKLHMPWFCSIVIVLINVFLTFIGYLSVKNMLRGNAAEALRPYVPKKMKPLKIEKTKLWKKLNFGTKWNLRDIMRHKARSIMTLFGIIGCTLLIIASFGMRDTMNNYVDVFYNKAINYNSKINLSDSATNEESIKLANDYEADFASINSVKVKVQTMTIEMYDIKYDRVKFLDQKMKFFKLENNGVYICDRVAEKFELKVGDEFEFTPYGEEKSYTVKVVGIIHTITEVAVMTLEYAKSIGFVYHINTLYTDYQNIATSNLIPSVQTKDSIIKSFDTFMSLMKLSVTCLIIAAFILGGIVLYNLGVMSFMERYREMATLKVVGFKDKKIGRLLISQNLWLTIIGLIIGLPVGDFTLRFLIKELASEYEMVPVVSWVTYLLTSLLTCLLSFVVSYFIARKNRKINMVESLKGID